MSPSTLEDTFIGHTASALLLKPKVLREHLHVHLKAVATPMPGVTHPVCRQPPSRWSALSSSILSSSTSVRLLMVIVSLYRVLFCFFHIFWPLSCLHCVGSCSPCLPGLNFDLWWYVAIPSEDMKVTSPSGRELDATSCQKEIGGRRFAKPRAKAAQHRLVTGRNVVLKPWKPWYVVRPGYVVVECSWYKLIELSSRLDRWNNTEQILSCQLCFPLPAREIGRRGGLGKSISQTGRESPGLRFG